MRDQPQEVQADAKLVLVSIVSLVGCIIDSDRVRVESFAADVAGTFTYSARPIRL